MSTTTPYMGLSKPEEGDDEDVWDQGLNDSLDLVDAHDHTTGKGVPVPAAGINIDDALDFQGHDAENISGALFSVRDPDTSPGVRSIWWSDGDDAFYLTNASGVDIQLTSGNTLDFSDIGGIEGDYGSANASFYYDQASATYLALTAAPSPNVWAAIAAGNVDLYEKASGITKRVRLSSPSGLAASYVVEFPAALPGSTAIAQITSAGVMTWSNTIVNDLTMTTDKHVTVSGTGEFKHGNKIKNISVAGLSGNNFAFTSGYQESSSGGSLYIPIPLLVGDRIQSVVVEVYGDGVADFTSSSGLYLMTAAGSFSLVAGASGAITNPPASWAPTTYTPSVPAALATGEAAVLGMIANAANLRVGNVLVTYDRP